MPDINLTPDASKVAEIARGLTKAQKYAIVDGVGTSAHIISQNLVSFNACMNAFGNLPRSASPSAPIYKANPMTDHKDLIDRLLTLYQPPHKPYPTGYVNPDGPDAVKVILALAEEIVRLKAMPEVNLHTLLGYEAGMIEGARDMVMSEDQQNDDWFRRNADRRNPKAFINTSPEYFASECAAAIMLGTLTHDPRCDPHIPGAE